MRYYAKYLGLVDAGRPGAASAVRQARDALTRLRSRLDQTALRFEVSPEETEVRLDRRELGRAPAEPVAVSPGPHQVTLWAEGYEPQSLDVEVAAGTTVPVVATLVRPPPPAPVQPAAGPETSADSTAWWLAGGAALLAAGTAAAVLLLAAEPEPDRYELGALTGVGR